MSVDSGVKWICPDCKRGFKREVFYIKHRSRASCISERDSILVNYSQSSSQSTSPRSSYVPFHQPSPIHPETPITHQQLIDWFDQQILLLRNSFIQQLRLLQENVPPFEEETKSPG